MPKKYCKFTDIDSLTLENYQLRIDLAGLLTYLCFATFPMFISGTRRAEQLKSSQLRDSPGFSPDSLFTFAPDGTQAPNPAAKVKINFDKATPNAFPLHFSVYPNHLLPMFYSPFTLIRS